MNIREAVIAGICIPGQWLLINGEAWRYVAMASAGIFLARYGEREPCLLGHGIEYVAHFIQYR